MANKKWTEHHFSKALKDQRDGRNLSQDQLAKLLAEKDIHMHWTTIAKIEKGERSVRIDEAAAIADIFDMSVDTLLGRKPSAQRDLDDALSALAAVDERKSRIVELRFFAGLSNEETGETLGISAKTVMREWQMAKVWLLRELTSR